MKLNLLGLIFKGLDETTFRDRASQVYQTMGKQTDFSFSAFTLALFGWKRRYRLNLTSVKAFSCKRDTVVLLLYSGCSKGKILMKSIIVQMEAKSLLVTLTFHLFC